MLPATSVKKPLTIIVCAILVMTLGIISFTKMQTNLLPQFELPYVVVYTSYPGANPEKVELAVTQPLESTLSTTGGLVNMTSVSNENTSMIVLEFAYSTNMDSAMIELNGNIELIKGYLDDAVTNPLVMQIDPDMLPVMVAAVSVDGKSGVATSDYVKETVIPALQRVEGVADVTGMGIVSESVEITLLPEQIGALNDKLIAAIDDKLGESQKDIDEGYAEVNKGRRALNSQMKEQKQSLLDAQSELESGRSKLAANKRKLAKALEQAQAGLSQLTDAKASLEKLILAAEGLPALDTSIAICQSELSAIDKTINPEAYAAKEQQLAALNAQKQGILAGMSSVGASSVTQLMLKLNDVIANISKAQSGIGELRAAQGQLEAAQAQLEASAGQIDQGRAQLKQAESEAKAKLDTAEEQLNSAQEQFDEAADEALRAADLGGRVTESMIAQMLAAQNFSMPAGYAEEKGERWSVKVGEKFASLADVRNLLLFTIEEGDIGEVRLSDVAKVELVNDASEKYAKVNGSDGILLVMQKQSSSSVTEVSAALRDSIEKLMQDDQTLHITTLSDQGIYIDIIVSSVLQNLLMGALLAIAVLLLFLRNFRPTLIVALSIPLSLMLAVTLMYFTGITLNIISLAGLALGIGMLVDNSIVVIENIYRLRAAGLSAAKAAVMGTKEVGGAIVASTLTTVCVFLPIVFAEGIAKELFVDMGLTIAYSLLASLLVAMTLAPSLGSMMLTNQAPPVAKFYDKMVAAYEKSLRFVLRHRAASLILVGALFAVSIVAVLVSGTAFMPKTDSSQIVAGITIEDDKLTTQQRRELADELSTRIQGVDGVSTVGAMEQGGGMMMGGSGDVTLYVLLDEQRKLNSDQIGGLIEEAVADMPVKVSLSSGNMDISMLSGSGIEVDIYGAELDVLRSSAREIAELLKNIDGVEYVDDGTGDTGTEQVISVDKNKAMEYSLTVAQVYAQVAERLKEENSATTFTIGGKDYPGIVVKGRLPSRVGLESIVIKGTQDGKEVKLALADIATFATDESADSISRSNNKRTISIKATLKNGYNIGIVGREAQKVTENYTLPDDYSMEFSGESETINDTLKEVINMALLAVLLIYLIMVAQFQSLLSPFIVMFTMPLAFTGGLLLQWACGMEVSVISMLGLLVLLGVVVNNGIVFVDCANGIYAETNQRREALVQTGVRRMRPILMTAMTTVLGLVTLGLGMGTGADMLQPMAIIIIGGLTYGTLLTLYVIPILYDLFVKKPPKSVEI
ncbi:MAG: efflux RND transporter permease subunit [Clostridia bacterium]